MHTRHRSILVLALLLAALPGAQHVARAQSAGTVTLPHVHGLTYSADGKRLIVAVHDGMAVYNAGRWSKDPGPRHDYMGFTATNQRFYSSGHPAPGSGLVNPLGLIRSGDGGKSWEKLSLEGESDFHLMAASWNTNAVYVWNHEKNSRMSGPGLHYTLNDGFMWQRAAAKGVTGKPHALAVHPGDAKIVAIATSAGIFLSRDSGDSFQPVGAKGQGLAVFFDLDGKHLWHSSHDGNPRLARTALQGGTNTAAALPPMKDDAVAYVAQNPAARGEYAIATFERNVFLTKDMGKSWNQIAWNGIGK